MADIRKRVITGIIACTGLYIMFEIYLLTVICIFGFYYLASKEFYKILKNIFQSNLKNQMMNDIEFETIGVYIIPLLFLLSYYLDYQEAIITMSLIIVVIICIMIRLYQYSKFCGKAKHQDPIKEFSFSCLSMIMGDIFFCISGSKPLLTNWYIKL